MEFLINPILVQGIRYAIKEYAWLLVVPGSSPVQAGFLVSMAIVFPIHRWTRERGALEGPREREVLGEVRWMQEMMAPWPMAPSMIRVWEAAVEPRVWVVWQETIRMLLPRVREGRGLGPHPKTTDLPPAAEELPAELLFRRRIVDGLCSVPWAWLPWPCAVHDERLSVKEGGDEP